MSGINIHAHILLVADHTGNQYVMTTLLFRLGFRNVDFAENGTEAVAMFEKTSYALILMDGQLNDMDAFRAAKHIRGIEEGQRHTPILAITADAALGDRERSLKAGIDDVINKPLDGARFLRMLAHYIPGDTVIRSPAEINTTSDLNERELFTLLSDGGNLALAMLEHGGELDPEIEPDTEH